MTKLVASALRASLVVVLALSFADSAAFAQHAAKGDNGVSGQQAAVDKNGKLRQPSADEAKELIDGLAPLLNHSTEGLNVIKHDDGTLSVDLQDRFMSAMVAKVGPDGKIEQKCVTSIEEAKQFFVVGAQAAPAVSKPMPALEEE